MKPTLILRKVQFYSSNKFGDDDNRGDFDDDDVDDDDMGLDDEVGTGKKGKRQGKVAKKLSDEEVAAKKPFKKTTCSSSRPKRAKCERTA